MAMIKKAATQFDHEALNRMNAVRCFTGTGFLSEELCRDMSAKSCSALRERVVPSVGARCLTAEVKMERDIEAVLSLTVVPCEVRSQPKLTSMPV